MGPIVMEKRKVFDGSHFNAILEPYLSLKRKKSVLVHFARCESDFHLYSRVNRINVST